MSTKTKFDTSIVKKDKELHSLHYNYNFMLKKSLRDAFLDHHSLLSWKVEKVDNVTYIFKLHLFFVRMTFQRKCFSYKTPLMSFF